MLNVHSGIDGNLSYNLHFEFIDKSIENTISNMEI
jgi:hypothetical protein